MVLTEEEILTNKEKRHLFEQKELLQIQVDIQTGLWREERKAGFVKAKTISVNFHAKEKLLAMLIGIDYFPYASEGGENYLEVMSMCSLHQLFQNVYDSSLAEFSNRLAI